MKRTMLLVLISLLTIPSLIQAQNKKTTGDSDDSSRTDNQLNSNEVYTVVEQMPQFPGGEEALMKYISDNLKYPIMARENGIQGRVICRFVVTSKGEINNAEVLRSLDPACDKESIRLIRTLPRFVPGRQNGVNVNVLYTLSITFKISNDLNQTIPDESKFNLKNYEQKDDLIETREFVVKAGIYDVVEDMPRFPGGDYALMIYLQKNTKYPESKLDIHGNVIVRFEVTKTGEIGRTEILKSLDPTFDMEALRVVRSLPKWTPGRHNGEYVSVWYILPIKFMLNQPEIKSTNSGVTLEIYESVKQMPQFPGGEKELSSYISKNIKYPTSAKQKRIQGNVYVRFIVTETGKLAHIEVVRPLTPDCDKEAVRLLENSPEWIPGKLDGKDVNVYYTISVPFKLTK